ncbi:MAG: 3'-5' exonuclease [Microvirga sp.]
MENGLLKHSELVFADVETTGVGAEDRVVSIGLVKISAASVQTGSLEAEWMHLVFDPGRDNHPRAEQIHGFSNWALWHQDAFNDHAETIWQFLNETPVVVGHNVSFDAKFISRELSASGFPPIGSSLFCTLAAYRRRGVTRSASLDTACSQIGLTRVGHTHGALEDAWLAMSVFLWLHDCPYRFRFPEAMHGDPTNMKPVPSRPLRSSLARPHGKVADLIRA